MAAAVAALAAIGGLAALAARSGGSGSGSGPSGSSGTGGGSSSSSSSSSGGSVPVPGGRNVFGLPAHTATASPVGREAADVDEEAYAQMWLAEEAEDAEWWMQELEKEKTEASNKVPPVPVPVPVPPPDLNVVSVQRPSGESFQAIPPPPPLAPETEEYQGPNNPTAPPTEVGGGGIDDAASSWSDLVWGRPLDDPESLAALAAAAAAAAEAAAATSPPATEDVPPPSAAPRPETPQSEEEETLLSLLEEIGMAAAATEENSQAPPQPAAPFVEDEEEGTTTELPPPVDEVELDSVWVDPPTVAKEQGEQGQQQQPAEVTCSGRCSDEFLAGCVAYECAQGSSSYDAWDTCRDEIDTGTGPLVTKVGCAVGCTDTAAMALSKVGACGIGQGGGILRPPPTAGPATTTTTPFRPPPPNAAVQNTPPLLPDRPSPKSRAPRARTASWMPRWDPWACARATATTIRTAVPTSSASGGRPSRTSLDAAAGARRGGTTASRSPTTCPDFAYSPRRRERLGHTRADGNRYPDGFVFIYIYILWMFIYIFCRMHEYVYQIRMLLECWS